MSSISGAQYQADILSRNQVRQQEVELLRKARDGDRAAYAQIVLASQDRLYNAVLRMAGNEQDALELTQETFVRGLAAIKSFRGEASAYTWLFRIAVNLVISQHRKQRHRIIPLHGGPDGPMADDQAAGLLETVAHSRTEQPAETLERREREQQVVAALGRLDAQYRAVLVMRDIEGFDYDQMAQVLDVPLGTLKSRLFRARLALRDELKGYISEGYDGSR